ncbi:MAG TPA: dolichyl-phosphate beta-glucosyltransferase [Candidatus Eisenbacteria bacterium]|nr:dolichyl-phosphate beta-glucosyltransferase [Candidatus Eisenbacteria bacterium]
MTEAAGEPISSIAVSVVIPAYNEVSCIGESLRRVAAYLTLKGRPWEALVSTDGSTDGTDEAVRAFAARLPEGRVRLLASAANRGKGAAVRRAVLEARGRYVLVTDADLSAPIKESDKLIDALEEGFDVAIGSRGIRKPGCDVRQSLKRRVSGRVFNWFVRALLLPDFRDTQCGFKAFRLEAARALFEPIRLEGYGFDVEVLYLALRKGLRVKEVPVMWSQGRDTKVRLLKDSFSMVGQLFFLRRHYGKSLDKTR